MKPTTLIFCGQDGNAGKAVAAKLRSEGAVLVLLRDAASFVGLKDDPADRVVVMPDVNGNKRQMIRDSYPSQFAPSHTDLMVSPESLDDFKEANPLPIKRGRGRPRKVAI